MFSIDFYRIDNTKDAYSLRWAWTGWPSLGLAPSFTEDDWNALANA